jgi:uncharacterized protein (DUF4415 family)
VSTKRTTRVPSKDPDTWISTAAKRINSRRSWSSETGCVKIFLDKDILEWFRKRGRGYQSRINAVLRTFVETHKQSRKARRAIVKS